MTILISLSSRCAHVLSLWMIFLFYDIKVLCYLQSEKIWVVFLQNYYMLAKSYHLHWIAGRANILRKYLIYKYFFNFGLGPCSSFSILFQKLQILVVTKFWNNFCCILLLFAWAKKVCLRFLKSNFRLEY